MNSIFEIHDSKVSEVVIHNGSLMVRFHRAILILLLLQIVVALVGCKSPTPMTESSRSVGVSDRFSKSSYSKNTHVIRGITAPGADIFGRRIFEVDNQRYTKLEDFKSFVRSLPRGSILVWDSGCIRYNVIPLEGSEMTTTDFENFCRELGIEFHREGGY